MRHEIETAPEERVDNGKCHHYWVIESPKGPTSRGVCKLCGEEREFSNHSLDFLWEGDISAFSELPGLPDIEPHWELDDS